MTIEEIKVSHLTRGTIYITNTSAGDIMLGLPPEILKETLDFSKGFPPAGIPLTCVIPDDLWNTESFQLNVECEFPFYGNKFLMGRKMNIVCEPSQEKQIFENQWLSLTGNRDVDLRSLYDDPLIVPSIRKESEFFTKVQKSEVANYILFNEKKEAIIQSDSGKVKITKLKKNTFSIFDETFNKEIGQFEIFEESHSRVVPDLSKKVISKKKYFGISSVNRFEVVEIIKKYKEKMLTLFYSLEETELVFREGLLESNFDFIEDESDRLKLYSFYENLDLRQKVIFISTQSGFDPLDKETNPEHRYGSTVSFCIIDEFSFITVVDPPFNCVQWLADNGIPLMMVKNVIITHNHADHDAGFSEFILRIGRKINLYTTESIMNILLKKINNNESEWGKDNINLIRNRFNFYPVNMKEKIHIDGYRYLFHHSVHSVETIGFSWENRFGEVIGYYAADTQLSESELDKMVSEGAMTTERKKKLLSLPKNAEIYIIENGIPPLHTDGDTLSKLPDYILDNLFLVHTSKYPTLSNGKVWDYPTLAKSGMTVDTRPRTGRSTDIKKRITVEHILDFAKIPFFRNMKFTPEELALIEREVERVYYKDGDVICKKDDPADSIYFMLEGGYQILPEGIEYQNKQKIMDARENRNDLIILGTPGAIMGESIAYKSRGRQKRTATVVAYGGRTSFLRFSKESFIRLMESDTDIGKLLRRMLEFKLKGIDNAFLNLEILRDLDSEEVRTFVAQKAHKTSFNKGEKLISEGATLKRLYILTDTNREEGVYLKQSQKSSSGKLLDGEKIFLTDHLLTSGCFGEQSIITGEPAVCDVVASGHLEVYYLKKADVLRMVKKYPAVQARIFQKIAKDRKDNADLHSQVSSIAETVVEHLKIEEDDSIGGF